MSTVAAGLARITINAPRRRVDVAVPDAVPLAELLPELLRHAGEGLADDGERHGGWVLRRADGTTLAPAAGLASQEVYDGTVLHLVPARTAWPELEYDDVVEAIAAGARRQGVPWSAAATRATAIGVTGACLVVALVLVVRADLALIAAAVAVALTLAGVMASRAYGDALVGASLAAYSLPFAAAGGWLGAAEPATPAARTLLGGVALLLAGLIAAPAIAHLLRIFVAGVTVGALGSLAGLIAMVTRPAAAAAVALAVLVAGVAGLPLLAVRLGRLPLPIVPLAADSASDPKPVSPTTAAERGRIFAAVARTDEMLTGMLFGLAVAAAGASLMLARSGDVSGLVLVAVASAALLLRARTFLTVRQRLPLLVAGAAGFGALALTVRFDGRILAALVPLVAFTVAIAGTRAAVRPVSPYTGRAADLLDTLCLVSVIPLACAVLGLYGMFT
ncbi:type VII secretion integral membrane protein EccD [Dactylosporangium matsuzakiense]|uniref:Type VII secretion integral membrane protein EccD n=1 Tax=Dactylosporangium matsuzakiense TaxID=53360 RepID=A0A9W6KNK3_9ACTN|nr:type VII secretion integral membrane protein EccD [Dactylosporangium matsuzakiense]UWZ45477.1 type VII secretion integral membrane protein EccD [Dactylosporangium matsuzakiense]GLL04372.1 type VII secretion integral membrane protein EccD [Dactylosporangium matsuzakiense]